MKTKAELMAMLQKASGGIVIDTPNDKIVEVIRVPGFELIPIAATDPRRAFSTLGITKDGLQGKTVLDIGSNVGGMSFEAAAMGAAKVRGIEFMQARVDAARAVAEFGGLTNVEFIQMDMHDLPENEQYDVVIMLSTFDYARNRRKMADLLGKITGEVLYLSINSIFSEKEIDRFKTVFKEVQQVDGITSTGTRLINPGFHFTQFLVCRW